MNHETIGHELKDIANMPDIRAENNIIKKLAPGKLPTEIHYALSSIVIRRLK